MGQQVAEVRLREPVVLATDYEGLSRWYQEALGLEVHERFTDYHYCVLKTRAGTRIAIGDATQMGVKPGDRAQNPVVLQFEVDDLRAFFDQLKRVGATIVNGPSYDDKAKFWFGGFADPEGNPCWVVDKDCP